MRINDVLTESKDLQEGPLLNKIGTGIGKAVGSAAKGIGAVGGGLAGVGKAFKKGWEAGKQTVGTGGDDEEDDQTTAPATSTNTQAIKKPAAPAAQTTNAAPTAAPSAPAAAPSQTAYAQVKAGIDKLDKKGKQRILGALNKELGTPAPQQAAPAQPSVTGAMAQQLAGKPNPAVTTKPSATGGTTTVMPGVTKHTANPNNPNAQQAAPAPQPAAPAPVAKKAPAAKGLKITGKKAAPAKAAPTMQAASKINSGTSLAESLAKKVEEQKKQMFSEELKTGKTSVFKK